MNSRKTPQPSRTPPQESLDKKDRNKTPHEDGDEIEGEGSYTASKAYNDAAKRFVDSGKVDKAAEDAAPRTETEARDMERAEHIGRSHAKEEDPEVSQPMSKKPRQR